MTLARIDLEALSEALFAPPVAERPECPFDSGWARHLYSGTGELLGMIIGLCDGPMYPVGLYITRIESVCRLAALAIEQRNLMQELAYQANHDPVTTLSNRHHYERALRWMLREKSAPGRHTALIYIDLDRLRLINDVMGLPVGNRLLAHVGRRFQSCLREADLLARVGGDEFAVLLPELAAADDSGTVAARLLESLNKPFPIDGHEIFISASAGIGRSRAESTAEALEREAYIALYQAKHAGKGRFAYFHPSMAATPPERLEMEKRLRSALARGEMLLYYQPQVELATGRVTGAEALLRWKPEGLGLVCPAAFVPILEETGLIVEFGRWVLEEACRQAKEWAGKTGRRLRMAVNVSALQFARPDFTKDVERALVQTGCPPELLELELTESLVIADMKSARRIFHGLQSSGITFAIDDFGTGHSALSYLQELPFQRLKIDRSFIQRIAPDGEYPALVYNIIRMAESLGMGAMAEGVETAYQAEFLLALHCQEVQGFYFSQPMPAGDFAKYCEVHAEEKTITG